MWLSLSVLACKWYFGRIVDAFGCDIRYAEPAGI
jgi:hypothetical protein